MPDARDRSRPLLLVVATVHLDSQWRWTIQQTIREFLPRTLRENFALFDSHPHYQLSFEGAFRYMLVREYYPREFEELKRWVAKGRWHPVGGMLDAPDVNVTSPESILRHILYGNRFFARELGRASRDVFLPDCFGFSQALPTIAAHCGLESFSSSKLVKWKTPSTIPFEIARWRGPGGGELVAAIQPGGYGEGIDEDLSRSPRWMERLGERAAVRLGMRYVGTGDRGGSPDRESLDRLEALVESDGPIRVRCGAADTLTSELTDDELERLPTYDGELLLPTHGTGCWTAQAALKRWNRKNELLGDSAERAALIADWLGAIDYPRQRLGEAWLRFLWHQMHDDLTGTSIPAAYRFTWNDEAVAANLFAGVLTDSISAIASELDTDSAGTPLVVFNPSSHRRRDVVEAILEAAEMPPLPVAVRDPAGRDVPMPDRIPGRRPVPTPLPRRRRAGITERLRGSGAPRGRVANQGPISRLATTGSRTIAIESRSIDEGNISSLFDKRLERQLLARPLAFELLRNRSMRWPAWEIRPSTVLDRSRSVQLGGPATVRVVESGPVRATLEIERRALGSHFRHFIRLAAGTAGQRVEIDTQVDWSTRGRLLKASFPLAVENPEATYDTGLGTIRRGNNQRERYEVPAQQWASLTDSADEIGVAILNDCKYGWDKPADNELRLSLIHSPSSLRKFPHQRTQDHGRHTFTLALCGHRGAGERHLVSQQADSLNRPLTAFVAPASRRTARAHVLSPRDQRARTHRSGAQEGRGRRHWVVRLRETAGRPVKNARLTPRASLLEADEISGCEEDPRPAAIVGDALVFDSPPDGLMTFALRVAPPTRAAARPERFELDLPWNHRASSFHDADEPDQFRWPGAQSSR